MKRNKQQVHKYLSQIDKSNDTFEITDAQLRSAVKRINDRIHQMNTAGLNNSVSYKSYKEFAQSFGGIQYGKRAHIHISIKKLTAEQKLDIIRADFNGGSLGDEMTKATTHLKQEKGEDYNPTRAEKIKTANKLGDIHEFIEDNIDVIYDVEDATDEFIRGNGGELTPAQVSRLFNVYKEWQDLKDKKKDFKPLAKQKTVNKNRKKWSNRPYITK